MDNTAGNFLDQFKDQLKEAQHAEQQHQQPPQDYNAYGQTYPGYTDEQYQQYYQQYYQQQYGYDYNQYYQQQAQPTKTEQPGQEGQLTDQQIQENMESAMADYYGQYYPQQGPPGGMYAPPFGFPMGYRPTGQEPNRSVWLGNIHPETTETELQTAFSQFGQIESVKVLPAKNCAFVRFVELDSAIQAHSSMIGASIHGQQVKLGWGKAEPSQRDDVGPPPCRNLWLGNISPDVSEDQIRNAFLRFGHIDKIRILPQKNCAFVNFFSLESAIQAKRQMQNVVIGDKPIRINFGKELSAEMFDTPQYSNLPKIPPPPPEVPPPEEPAKGVIDKLAEFVSKKGATFEDMIKEKQKNNPKFNFLQEDGENHGYYKWILWRLRYPEIDPKRYHEQVVLAAEPPIKPSEPQQQTYASIPPPDNLNNTQSGPIRTQKDEDSIDKLSQILENLVPTRESIKEVKTWIMQRPKKAKEIANFLKLRVEKTQDFESKQTILYLIHDILHQSSRNRAKTETTDVFFEAFTPHLGRILNLCYEGQNEKNQEKIANILRIWEDKRMFDSKSLRQLQEEMKGKGSKPSTSYQSHHQPGESRKEKDDRSSRDKDKDRDRDYHRDRNYDYDYDSSRDHRKRRDRDDYDRRDREDYDRYSKRRY